MTIEMTTTTDRTEIRNSADDDAPSDFLGILTNLAEENAALTAEIEWLRAQLDEVTRISHDWRNAFERVARS